MNIYERNYKRIRTLIGEELESFPEYLRFEAKGMMPLTFDRLKGGNGSAQYAMTHWYKQNGDLIADPEMIIEIKGQCVEALSIQHAPPFDRIMSVYNEERTQYRPTQKREQNDFLGMWLRNIAAQGYERMECRMETDKDSEVALKKENLLWLDCACCGRGFKGWQHYDRDDGYGICDDGYCFQAYGYHTVGERPKEA
ncbi:MAG: hypothetical protein EOP04_02960 [Proteobacteria bacterium]|nr:MAG: hypothetical protein EOP04_02960 [Pseudomonadota bacterium]